jgi:hypothetical protein
MPLAERWGIGDDVLRNDLVARATYGEKRELHEALAAPFEQIGRWLDSFGEEPMSDEAAAFMYMQEALDEMGFHVLEERAATGRPLSNGGGPSGEGSGSAV